MNLASVRQIRTTHAADGFDRMAFTVSDIERMTEAGVLGPDDRFELIEGEIVCGQPKLFAHERIRLALNRAFSRSLPDHLQLGAVTSAFLSDITVVDPDLSIFPMMNTQEVRGPDLLLAIEVADSSLAKDLNLKAGVYAKYGVRELWVIDANARVTHLFRTPVDGVWTQRETLGPDHALTHAAAPEFSLRLSDL
jgi:Uma2 family endonuclease